MTLRVVLWHYLNIAPHLLLVGAAAALCRRGEYRKHPIFLAYLISEIIQFLILYPMLLIPTVSGSLYFMAFSVGNGISIALRFGMIHEIFAQIFRNYPALDRFGKPMFRWVTVLFLWAGLLLAYYVRSNDPNQLFAALLVMRRTADILQCGLLLMLFFFSSYFGLSWRHHTFGIALGLGIFATAGLAESAIRSHLGSETASFLDFFLMAVYHVCVLIWLAYLWLPERVSQFGVKAVPEHDLESWNEELQRLIRQ